MNGFMIKNIEIKNKVILAPMAGVSNAAYRKIAKEFGAGLVVAEMVSDKGLLYDNGKSKEMLYISEFEHPVAMQIFGGDIDTITKAAIYIDKNCNCDIIDINMGCPVPKVAIKAQAGSSLLKNPNKIYEIVKSVVDNVSKPVTVKIRSGWDEKSINAVEVAKEIERAGASAITVHARTRAQGYTGKANWDIIKQVKESVSIPIIGNGDVVDGKSAKEMMLKTNCDAIMVGRAAIGNPWIFKEINYYLEHNKELERPQIDEIKKVMLYHFEELEKLKCTKLALLEMRGIASHYIKGIKGASQFRKQLSVVKSKKEFEDIVKSIQLDI